MKVQKIAPADDPEVFLNVFEMMATSARWPEAQWAAELIPCMVRPAQQAVDTLIAWEVTDYQKV